MYQQIKQLFELHRDPEAAAAMAAYMQNRFSFYGLHTPQRRQLCREPLKAAKKQPAVDWAFVDACFADEYRELQYTALDYLDAVQSRLTYDDTPRLKQYAQTKQWWDSIDCLDRIIGNIGLIDPRLDALMLEWSQDADFWLRRIAIDHQLLRKQHTNTQLLAAVIVNNLGSSEFFINKAIGWSLREYSKTDADWVRQFIQQHRERMSRLSIREASKYI